MTVRQIWQDHSASGLLPRNSRVQVCTQTPFHTGLMDNERMVKTILDIVTDGVRKEVNPSSRASICVYVIRQALGRVVKDSTSSPRGTPGRLYQNSISLRRVNVSAVCCPSFSPQEHQLLKPLPSQSM